MKISGSLLQAMTLGVSITAVAAVSASCEKAMFKTKKEQQNDRQDITTDPGTPTDPGSCPACGMG